MKFLAAICVLAVGVSAQVGPSGIVSPDGKNVQFSHDFVNRIVLVGPSGIVTSDGSNLQLTSGQAGLNLGSLPAPLPYARFRGVVGPSGIVRPGGKNIQFSQAQVDNNVLVGPSGIVTKDGKNIQFQDEYQYY
ncbi:cuticle protein CP1158 [Procambarus clarkii]|uniref:cuticle protein CP1158 n=1 Tax=Procambarus clarkii TaxID=6728 RepID=UPI001E677EBE|nr:cuticle protein CP1158-like [Procambarus clarkii]